MQSHRKQFSTHLSYGHVNYKDNFGGRDEQGHWSGLIGGVHNEVHAIYV